MKTKILQKSKHIILSSIFCIAVAFTATARSYTLTDDDVVVENGVITYCSYNFAIKDIVIPKKLDGQTVTGIAKKSLFSGVFYNKGITSVSLPATIEFIGSNAFHENSLTSLNLSSCTALTSIGFYAFAYNKVKTLNLSNCSALTSICQGAFYDNSLTKLVLNTALTCIEERAFYENSLRTLDLSGCSALTNIGYGAFAYNKLTKLNLSGCSALTSIGDIAFWYNSLTTLDLSGCSALTNIEDHAFAYNDLTTLDLSGCSELTSIGIDAFSGNDLSSLDLSGCTALTSIGIDAFRSNDLSNLDLSGCTALTNIGKSAFAYNKLTKLDLSGCSALTSIGNSAFSSNDLSNLDLSGCTALTNIGNSAFGSNGLSNLDLSGCTALTYIGDYAFVSDCLSSVDLSYCKSLTSIGVGAFTINGDLSFNLPINTQYASFGWKDGSGYAYAGGDEVNNLQTNYYVPVYILTDEDVVVENGVITACSYNFNIKSIIIPETIGGQTVTGIADGTATDGVFYNKGITYVQLPATLETLGNWAFANNSLDSLDLSACIGLTSIGVNALCDNTLTYFILPGNNEYGYCYWKNGEENILAVGDEVSNFETDYYLEGYYILKFYDWDYTELKSDTLMFGSDAIPPADPIREGYTFIGWDTTFTNITESYDITAEYEIKSSVTKTMNSVLELYPNPTKGMLYVSGKAGWQIQLFTLSGQRLQQIVMNNKNTQLNLSEYPEGTYILKVGNDSVQVVRKVVKK